MGPRLVGGNYCLGQGLEVFHRLRVGQLAVLEVARLEVDRDRKHLGPEPGQHRTELGVQCKEVMVCGAHSHQPARLRFADRHATNSDW